MSTYFLVLKFNGASLGAQDSGWFRGRTTSKLTVAEFKKCDYAGCGFGVAFASSPPRARKTKGGIHDCVRGQRADVRFRKEVGAAPIGRAEELRLFDATQQLRIEGIKKCRVLNS